jgi:ABC-type multidrug transport system ATPase subunit
MQYVIEVNNLSRTFKEQVALDDVTIQLTPGKVYGLLGENGAGKSTLIKHIIGALQPQTGSVKVLGLTPASSPVEVLSQIGYLSEDRDLPMWMRVSELLNYTAAFFDSWDKQYAQELLEKFHLAPNVKVKNMSRGEKARVGLITALAHRPALLVLDEPSSGLDVSVRYDILSEVMRSVTDSGRTILFSSHLLDEVERVTDNVIMINKGKKTIDGHVDTIKEQHYRYIVKFADETDSVKGFLQCDPQLIRTLQQDSEWLVVSRIPLQERLKELGGKILESPATSLENVFMDYCSLENYHGK